MKLLHRDFFESCGAKLWCNPLDLCSFSLLPEIRSRFVGQKATRTQFFQHIYPLHFKEKENWCILFQLSQGILDPRRYYIGKITHRSLQVHWHKPTSAARKNKHLPTFCDAFLAIQALFLILKACNLRNRISKGICHYRKCRVSTIAELLWGWVAARQTMWSALKDLDSKRKVVFWFCLNWLLIEELFVACFFFLIHFERFWVNLVLALVVTTWSQTLSFCFCKVYNVKEENHWDLPDLVLPQNYIDCMTSHDWPTDLLGV